MSDDFWKPTADMFGQFISKPKMSDKLLKKPPFRYIFDIISETTKKTGLTNGLYSGNELDSNQSRDEKIIYLEKIKLLCELMNGVQLEAAPKKIVAGHEPDNTNILLQSIYQAATSGKDSGPYVQKVLSMISNDQQQDDNTQHQQQEQLQKQQQKELQQQNDELEKQKKLQEKREQKRKQQEAEAAQKKQMEQQAKQKQQEDQQRSHQQQSRGNEKKAPKTKSNIQADHQQVKQKPKGIIMENDDNDDDQNEDEQETNYTQNSVKMKSINAKQQGKFVREAMQQDVDETKQQDKGKFEVKSKIKMSKIGKKNVGRNKNQAAAEQEEKVENVDSIKQIIQSLCQFTTPLGKSLEFLNDDIETMNKEMEYWRKQYLASQEKYLNEQKITQEYLQKSNHSKTEVEEQILDQKQKIQALKAKVLRNEETIASLLDNVISQR